ncbi:MAG: DoxX family protein [Acidobacteriota bacterium]
MRGSDVLVWSVQALLGILFLIAALSKLSGNAEIVEMFAQSGYPDHFYILVGGVELIGAVLVLIPQLAGHGAIALGVVMIGATVTHAMRHEPLRAGVTLVILGLLLYVIRKRLPAFAPRPDEAE